MKSKKQTTKELNDFLNFLNYCMQDALRKQRLERKIKILYEGIEIIKNLDNQSEETKQKAIKGMYKSIEKAKKALSS